MSLSTKRCTALIRIVCDVNNFYLRRPDGQYIPHNVVDVARRESLIGLFRKHKVIKIEPCLHSTGGEHVRDLYLATFPSERRMVAAIDAWDDTDVEDTPYIEQLALEEIKQDRYVELPTSNEDDNTSSHGDAEPKPKAELTTQNNFEDWWATQDPENWAEHQTRLQRTIERNTNGVWVYEDEAGNNPTTFTYAPHPIIEYGALDSEKYSEPLITTINWDVTRDDERFNLGIPKIVRPEWLPINAAEDAMSVSDESDSEDAEYYCSTPESSPPRTPVDDSLDIFESSETCEVSLEDLEESDFDVSPRGRNKTDRSRTLLEGVKHAALEDAFQDFKSSSAKSDSRSLIPYIAQNMRLSAPTATHENQLASSLKVSLDIFDKGASKLELLEESIFDLSPHERKEIDTSRSLFEIVEQASVHNAMQKLQSASAKHVIRSSLSHVANVMKQLVLPDANGSALTSSLSLTPQDEVQGAHHQTDLNVAQVAATFTFPTHDSACGIQKHQDDIIVGLTLNAGVATTTEKFPSPALTIGAPSRMAQATSDPPMRVELDFAKQDINISSLPYRNIALADSGLEDWTPLPDVKLTADLSNDMSLHTKKDLTFPASPPQSPSLPPVSKTNNSRIAESTIITEEEAPIDHLENMWWKLVLLLIIDYLTMGILSQAIAYPLECLLVALVLHTGRNVKGGLAGWIWQEEVDRDLQLDFDCKEGDAGDGRISPTDSGIWVDMMGDG